MKFLMLIALATASTQLSASPICSFECLTLSDSNLAVCAPVAPQFSMEVVDVSPGIVGFQFGNAGPGAVSVTNLYFSDPLNAVAGFDSEPWSAPGVSFASGGPDILPAIAALAGFTQEFKAQAVAGGTLDPGESVTVLMALAGLNTADTVRQALVAGDFRVIVATLGIGGADRTVYLEATCCDVPEPAALGLVGFGLILFLVRKVRANYTA